MTDKTNSSNFDENKTDIHRIITYKIRPTTKECDFFLNFSSKPNDTNTAVSNPREERLGQLE
jgi:hypothetical protein